MSKKDSLDILLSKISKSWLLVILIWMVSFLPLLYLTAVSSDVLNISFTVMEVLSSSTNGEGHLPILFMVHLILTIFYIFSLVFVSVKKNIEEPLVLTNWKLSRYTTLLHAIFLIYVAYDAWEVIEFLFVTVMLIFIMLNLLLINGYFKYRFPLIDFGNKDGDEDASDEEA
tara:strand:- start:270 stop:782 length:513 start_codon:yes stop_codon:yes gene_type:complete